MDTQYIISKSVPDTFFQSITNLLQYSRSTRDCGKHSDSEFLVACVRRAIAPASSGRDFVQSILFNYRRTWTVGNFFDSIKSKRRTSVMREVLSAQALLLRGARPAPAWMAECPELENYEVHAGDGTCFAESCHGGRAEGKHAVGHLFLLNLRSGAMDHLCVCDPEPGMKKKHEIAALKSLSVEELRRGAGRGVKVVYVWDRAVIDDRQWFEWKRRGVYYVSREKENMVRAVVGENEFDALDARNTGVVSDEMIGATTQVLRRRIGYVDPETGGAFAFITNEFRLPPGVVVWMYRRRWDIEKQFDVVKNKMREGKSWGATVEAKTVQAVSICLALNALLLLEDATRKAGLEDGKEALRREKRREKTRSDASAKRVALPSLIHCAPVITQIGVKFIRWFRGLIDDEIPWSEACDKLRHSYNLL